MNTFFCKNLLIQLSIAIFTLWQLPAHGMPKAAENEDAPVVISPDVAKPKAASKPAKKEIKKKTPPPASKKAYKPAPAPKKAKTTPSKK